MAEALGRGVAAVNGFEQRLAGMQVNKYFWLEHTSFGLFSIGELCDCVWVKAHINLIGIIMWNWLSLGLSDEKMPGPSFRACLWGVDPGIRNNKQVASH